MNMFEASRPRQTTNAVLDIKEKAIQIVRSRGPLLPVQITKELGVNVMFASAILSELVDNGTIKLSNTKVGGSPVYYVAGQEAKLQALRDKLNDKQQRAFDILKQAKVLRDVELEPVIRVALRDIKDFAHPLRVTSGSINEIFWKWYLVPDNEAEPVIKEKLSYLEKKEPKKDVQQELSEIDRELKKLEEQKKVLMPIEHKVKEEVKEITKQEEIKEKYEKISKQRKPRAEKQIKIPIQTQIEQQIQIDESDSFMMKVLEYFKQNNIEITEIRQIRKDSDFEGTVKIPTAVGVIQYFCKAKNKQKINDSDLSLLYVQSQMKKMPVLLITTGDTTKKALELLNKEFKNITIKKI